MPMEEQFAVRTRIIRFVSTAAFGATAMNFDDRAGTDVSTTSKPGTCSVSVNDPSSSGATKYVLQDSAIHALAGGVGSAMALALTYPLDQLRTLQQVQEDQEEIERLLNIPQNPAVPSAFSAISRHWRRVLALVQRQSGLQGLYRGILPVVISMGVSNLVFFGISKAALQRYRNRTGRHIGYFATLATNTIAGILNVFVTAPLWVASMRAKLRPGQGSNLLAILWRVYKEEGIRALWAGTLPSLLLVINPVLQHFLYDSLKRYTLYRRQARRRGWIRQVQLTAYEAFLFGAIGKLIATFVSYPLQVAQSRLRKQAEEGGGGGEGREYTGTADCLQDLYSRRGLGGLFQGIESKVLQTVLTSAFMFTFYERLYRSTKRLLQQNSAQKSI